MVFYGTPSVFFGCRSDPGTRHRLATAAGLIFSSFFLLSTSQLAVREYMQRACFAVGILRRDVRAARATPAQHRREPPAK